MGADRRRAVFFVSSERSFRVRTQGPTPEASMEAKKRLHVIGFHLLYQIQMTMSGPVPTAAGSLSFVETLRPRDGTRSR